jgi:hypothetical protein
MCAASDQYILYLSLITRGWGAPLRAVQLNFWGFHQENFHFFFGSLAVHDEAACIGGLNTQRIAWVRVLSCTPIIWIFDCCWMIVIVPVISFISSNVSMQK